MLIFAWWKIHYFQIFLIRYSLAKLVRLNYRLKPRRCPSPHQSSFSRSQVSTLRLVFCRNRFCIFDACVNRLWQSWIYDAACPCASNLCVPPYEKRKEQTQTKKREERKERQRRGKNRTTGRHNRGRASINRSEAQGWRSTRRIVSSLIASRGGKRGDEEDESYPVDRANSCLSPCGIDCERVPLDVTVANRTLAFRAVYEQHYAG